MPSRRRVLRWGAGMSASLGSAGCLTAGPGNGDSPTETPTATPQTTPTETPTDEVDVENPDPASEATFNAWEPDTNCTDGTPESMYNSEISVQSVIDDRPAGSNPIAYAGLPADEKRILGEVLAVGGYATCETSEAFQSFAAKAVYEHAATQDGDETSVYLEYDETYYKLYIRKQDQVFAY